MNEELPPQKPFTLSGWLVSSLITSAVIFGALGGLFVLLLGDKFWNLGEDPAINGEVHHQVSEMDQRVQQLEQEITKQPEIPPGEISELKQDVTETAERTAALQEKVEQIDQARDSGNTYGTILLGLTQLKSAYEYDMPLQPGIETLKSAVKDNETVREILAQLDEIAAQGIPSRNSIIAEIDALNAPQPVPSLNQAGLTWQDRARLAVGKFVRVEKAETVAQRGTLQNLKQAVLVNDLKTARTLVTQLPQNASTQLLLTRLETRLKVQQLMHDALRKVTNKVTRSNTGLY